MNSSVGEKVLKNIKPFWNIFVETSKKQPADVTSSGKFLSESKCDINIKFNKENIFIFGQTHETEKFLKRPSIMLNKIDSFDKVPRGA